MIRVREDRIFLGGETYGCELGRQLGGILHFDAAEIVESMPRPIVPADAISDLAHLSRNFADVRDETFPLHGNFAAVLERVALVQSRDQHFPPMVESKRAQAQRLGANAGFLPSEFGSKFCAKVLGLEHLANLDFTIFIMGVGTALDPLDRLFL